ncbi:hypothetical protein DFH08DRAFT_1080417 [Mycena albidolilacea]|uniref:Uncharacterized protein n=1 Tax=Mycena albidolilacea TaxID=1033008 RepID=A0AAD7ERH6_9AGAR|nr:hypothetical protein DFH08DRAFT_1080417 [Mycena albidolilacea]
MPILAGADSGTSFFHGRTVAPEQEASVLSPLDDAPIRSAFELTHPGPHTGSCPHSKIASFPAKPSCIQLAAKVRTLYSVRNAPRPTTIEHSIPTLPTPRPSPSISWLSLAILCSLARTLNASVAFRYMAPPFASLAQHALDPRFVYVGIQNWIARRSAGDMYRHSDKRNSPNIQGLRSVSSAKFVFQGSAVSRTRLHLTLNADPVV